MQTKRTEKIKRRLDKRIAEDFPIVGDSSAIFFVIEAVAEQARILHRHDAERKGDWAQPNKHFES